MGSGFLDGTHASLISRAIDTPLRVGVVLPPVQAQPMTVNGAIRLVNNVNQIYDTDVDTSQLEAFAQEMEEYFAGLTERLERENAPEDLMFM